ncbi:hypothetical protein [Pedobacter helvus]|uniref:Uncharacterized protein n=1 Tax=Pedobacter helvus TaxID=2563444 RepID=A0ABW9JC98_9SPHI|nr:hypothetical protein [Pedobacter ureilyticus]
MTIIKNHKALNSDQIFSILNTGFNDYFKIVQRSELDFVFNETYGTVTISSSKILVDEVLITVVIDEEEVLVSQNYIGVAYDVSVIFNHLVKFISLTTSANLDNNVIEIYFSDDTVIFRYETKFSFYDFCLQLKAWENTVNEKNITFVNEIYKPNGNTIDLVINYGDGNNIARITDYKFNNLLKKDIENNDAKKVKIQFITNDLNFSYPAKASFDLINEFNNPAGFAAEGEL